MALTAEQEQYLNQRGFRAIEAIAGRETEFPYVALGPITTLFGRGEVEYHMAPGVADFNSKVLHPSRGKGITFLVDSVAQMVIDHMQEDGTTFTTQPGTPIKIYIEDRTWKRVAKTLEQKFK
ncbi:hypothetical protein HOC80_05165 [archaeon]|jgi:hypothetical protein|nr:hypothetical protein [archaeon]MBT4417462.1 hypothetical protein [archaeon]